MNGNLKKQIQETQAIMLEHTRSCFSESERDHLRGIVRLTIEFNNYLQSFRGDADNVNDLKYSIESIFSGIDSFCSVNAAYRVLVGATSSKIEWNQTDLTLLKDQFASMFDEFNKEANFEKKCRLLLDLFKLQIVFAGVFYN
jgi:hypothetical protein